MLWKNVFNEALNAFTLLNIYAMINLLHDQQLLDNHIFFFVKTF